jgi:glycosyltransferase involved in cell wall biosynthesis
MSSVTKLLPFEIASRFGSYQSLDMIRITFLIRSLHHGGAEGQLATLVQSLDTSRFDVTVITFYSGGHFDQQLKESKIRIIGLRKRGRWDVVQFLWRLIKELRRLKPDILHSYLVEPNIVGIFLKPLFRTTRIVWGIRASNMQLENYGWFARLNSQLQRYTSRFADLIIVNSESGRDYHVQRGFPAQKCIVIHGGVDLDKFKPAPEGGKEIRDDWGIPSGATLIGAVGRLDPIKDHATFLKAVALLTNDRPDLRIACVGGGSEQLGIRLRRLAEKLEIADRITWAGNRDDMPAVYNALDLVCSSSLGEGFPNAIAEAMACGVPCVVTGVGDSALLVSETGVVVPSGDPQALAVGLKAGLDLIGSNDSPDPRARIARSFSLASLVGRTEEALEALVDSSANG